VAARLILLVTWALVVGLTVPGFTLTDPLEAWRFVFVLFLALPVLVATVASLRHGNGRYWPRWALSLVLALGAGMLMLRLGVSEDIHRSLEGPVLRLMAHNLAFLGILRAMEHWGLRDATRGLLTVVIGVMVVVSPFALERLLAMPGDQESLNSLVSTSLELSAPAALAPQILGTDLFKQESLYRSFLVGEQLVTTPSLGEVLGTWKALSGLLAAVLGLCCLVRWRLGVKRLPLSN